MTDLNRGDRVRARYKDSFYTGTIISPQTELAKYVEVRFAPGVSMIFAPEDVELLQEMDEDDD